MFEPVTVSCPVCGAFQRGLDPIGMVVFLGHHNLAMVVPDGDYDELVRKALDEAEGALK